MANLLPRRYAGAAFLLLADANSYPDQRRRRPYRTGSRRYAL
jgi:hypothetical protein